MFAFAASRRGFLGGTAALVALLPGLARAAAGNAQLGTALQGVAARLLRRSPEQATLLGADRGANADLAGAWSDGTPAGIAEDRRAYAECRALLAAVPRTGLAGADITNLEAATWALTTAKDGEGFGYGFVGPSGGSPYAVTQQNGTYSQAAEFLDSYHRLEDKAGADAYVSRLGKVAALFDAETDKIRADAALGVVPPAFVLANAIGQQQALAKTPAGQSKFVQSYARRAAKLGLPDRSAELTAMVESQLYPALARQTAALQALPRSDDAGVWKLPQGDAYYRYNLRAQTTTSLSPDEIHKTGWEQNRAYEAEMDAILKAQGITQGSVGARAAALNNDPRFLEADSDAGRAKVIADVQGAIDGIRKLLPAISKLGLKAPIEVKRVPVDIQDGASLGYMNFAAPDGSRPAIYYINLKKMDFWPRWTLATLSAHEGLPGHAWQGAYLAEHPEVVSPVAQLIGFNAFVEGWALYAEQLVDEAGYYAKDPFGRLGYLNAARFRAVRLIVDTGIHAMKWSRDKAIEVMMAETGRARGAVTSEIDRYCVSPGQACGYKIGHNEILRQRARAKAALGAKWDQRDFNDALVVTGGVPLASLPGVVDRMIGAVRA
ncbi:hypothetical protein IP88_08740 [alpha proteobacterium AAP81b]|nr:hypothetical protein IP88_08740 [alpha proteobacterium AAP81b]